MKFVMNHNNINVRDLDKSVKFYQEAFGLTIARVHEPEDKSFKLVFLEDENHYWRLELTWLRDHADKPYDLGENESHLGLVTDDYEAAHALHEKMGCICFENPSMGIYFVEDPDGYWVEVVPPRSSLSKDLGGAAACRALRFFFCEKRGAPHEERNAPAGGRASQPGSVRAGGLRAEGAPRGPPPRRRRPARR